MAGKKTGKKPDKNPGWVALPGARPEDIVAAFTQRPPREPKASSKHPASGGPAAEPQQQGYQPGDAVSEPQPLPASATLTDLPLKWLVLTLIVCIGVSYLWQQVEQQHLVNTVRARGLMTEDEIKAAKASRNLREQREAVSRRVREHVRVRRQLREAEKSRPAARPGPRRDKAKADALAPLAPKGSAAGVYGFGACGFAAAADSNAPKDDKTSPFSLPDLSGLPDIPALLDELQQVEIPMTPEALREWIKIQAGDQYEEGRKTATLIALGVGAFGLILLAIVVRVIGAMVLGGATFAATFFTGVEPGWMWVGTGAAALAGFMLAPRVLLATVYGNGALAGMVIGAVALGGGAYMFTEVDTQGLMGVGVGAAAGALAGIKLARPLYLCALLANTAGLATAVLWLCWGDLFEHFVPVTFGGLMITDAVITRIYHKVRWKN